jgi:hypothetical protein
MLALAGGFRRDQLLLERDRDPGCDLVLQSEQIARVAVEALGPQMRAGRGIDQLGIDADLIARPLDATLQHIADAQLAADLLCVGRLVPIGERGAARDHEHIRDPRQVGREIVGNPIGKILLAGIITEIDEGQHDDRQARCDERLRD